MERSVGSVPAVSTLPPDNAALRAKVISMHVRGISEDTIARDLALSPETVRQWTALIG